MPQLSADVEPTPSRQGIFMAKGKSRIVLTYRYAEHEMVQVCLDLASSYPDALAEGRATARTMMRDTLADIGLTLAPIEADLVEPDAEP